jgi:hypothetical protein
MSRTTANYSAAQNKVSANRPLSGIEKFNENFN